MKEKNYNIYLLIRFNLLLIYSFIIALNIYIKILNRIIILEDIILYIILYIIF